MTGPAPIPPRPRPLFLGYCLKRLPLRPEWLNDPRVATIASVSTCIAERPDGWTERWDFNGASFYACPADATGAADSPDGFSLFAYEFFPLRFDPRGGTEPADPVSIFGEAFPATTQLSLAPGLDFLGYDPVQRWAETAPGIVTNRALGGGFGCSPLSCNGYSTEYPVTTHCLLPTWEDAARAARAFAVGPGAEPGCYYIFGVYGPPRR